VHSLQHTKQSCSAGAFFATHSKACDHVLQQVGTAVRQQQDVMGLQMYSHVGVFAHEDGP
jgi:tRNA/tmRNA/rRNA uracil-C5-methylase (TrmA/RlmC/RlmD family)